MSRVEYLKTVYELEKIARGVGKNGIDKNRLEEDFLRFSAYSSERKLQVRFPQLYILSGEEKKNIEEVRQALGISPTPEADVEAIDISGYSQTSSQKSRQNLIITSLQQINADHHSASRSYLNPLLQEVFEKGMNLIHNFSLHEALFGKIKVRRGALDLAEINLFPEKISSGTYTLEVELDTPAATVRNFRKLHEILDEADRNPKANLLDPERIQKITARGLKLRQRLGSLSRYEIPKEQVFTAETNSCVLEEPNRVSFYLYDTQTKKNTVVYFGEPLFASGTEPRGLTVLQGDAYEDSLAELVKDEVFQPSLAMLESRIEDITVLYEQALRSRQENADQFAHLQGLQGELQEAKEHLETIANPKMRTEYALRLPHEWLEFMVYPATEDPVIHDLLSRLSWNKAIRDYHNTGKFKVKYTEADGSQKAKMLQEVRSNLIFRNQQNEEVNLWLYQNHLDFCQKQGIEFEVAGAENLEADVDLSSLEL